MNELKHSIGNCELERFIEKSMIKVSSVSVDVCQKPKKLKNNDLNGVNS